MANIQNKESKAIKAILFALNHHSHMDKGDKDDVLIARTAEYPNLNEYSTLTERIFAISGKDVYESGYNWSCGTLAKDFCYVNANLHKILKELKTHKSFKQDIEKLEQDIGPLENIEPLKELQVMISTHPEHLIDGMMGHTLPCVKMDDGKWYAIEPNVKSTVANYPQHPKYPGIPLIMDEIKVGNNIHHIFKGIDVPYEIRSVLPWSEYEKLGFSGALKCFYKHDKNTQMLFGLIETVLKSIDLTKKEGKMYDFCKKIHHSKMPITIMGVTCGKYKFSVITININGDLYYFMPTHSYPMMHKIEINGDIVISGKEKWNIIWQQTPKEYIKSYEDYLNQSLQNQGRE